MKKILLLAVLIASACLQSCNSSDDNGDANQTIVGSWYLKSGNGTISGRVDEFADEQITWSFMSNNTVAIVNTVTDPNKLSGLPSGTYTYAITNNADSPDCPKTVIINSNAYHCSTITSSEMQVGDGFADGVYYTFQPAPQMVTF
ncbi:MAG: hypothetical protein CFE23_14200 [Flavobacterium sp. BFFFF1]|uniref:hypothetical protein n=1 Tax=unclassified Flavobacterium TaxID=196869 RepID=UPI000BC3662B|nr:MULTISPECIES: hypothetical protein [unclassified Flavobacterium]OYU79385.1 MAG: hypothetical protein CFE23_14200 [Flavobacterium sp. BFFFF1]